MTEDSRQRAHSFLVAPVALALLPWLAACGSSAGVALSRDASAEAASPGGTDASPLDAAFPPGNDASPDGPGSLADAGPRLDGAPLVLPQVLSFDGGTLATPRLVAVTFPGDTEAAQIDAFTSAIGQSAYWRAVTSEYGVGATTGSAILETEPAPTAVNQAAGDPAAWLATRFDGTHPEWGTFDPGAVYLVFYPSTTSVTPNVGGCGGAYHQSMPITALSAADGGGATNGTLIYGVVFRCATSPDVGRPSGLDLTTYMASHEMVEAVTDPYGTGFAQTDNDDVAWAYFFGSELGDMCAFHPGAAVKPADLGFTVQRSWSNAAAAALLDPCVPAQGAPLFLAAPLGDSAITLSDGAGGAIHSRGFTLPVGQSITVDVAFYGAAAGAWTASPFTYAMEHGQADPYLRFSPATLSGHSGDVAPLTITRIAADTAGNGADGVKLVSSLGPISNEWYFAVTN